MRLYYWPLRHLNYTYFLIAGHSIANARAEAKRIYMESMNEEISIRIDEEDTLRDGNGEPTCVETKLEIFNFCIAKPPLQAKSILVPFA